MNIANLPRVCDIANGPGIRVTLFVSGCRLHCPNCFNKEAQDFNYGQPYTEAVHNELMEALKKPWIHGFTCLGGEPFEPENQNTLCHLFKDIKRVFPDKTIWCYTGYIFDKDLCPGGRKYVPEVTDMMLRYIDVLVDGPFIEDLKDPSLKFRGSSNQRILHLKHERTVVSERSYIDYIEE